MAISLEGRFQTCFTVRSDIFLKTLSKIQSYRTCPLSLRAQRGNLNAKQTQYPPLSLRAQRGNLNAKKTQYLPLSLRAQRGNLNASNTMWLLLVNTNAGDCRGRFQFPRNDKGGYLFSARSFQLGLSFTISSIFLARLPALIFFSAEKAS